MTLVETLPGTPDPTLPIALPDLGLSLTHLYSPFSLDLGTLAWKDEIGSLPLASLGGTGTPTLGTESGVSFVQTSAARGWGSVTGLDPAALRTQIAVMRLETGDELVGVPYALHASGAGLSVTATAWTTVPGTTSSAISMAKWHILAMVMPAAANAFFVKDTEVKNAATQPQPSTIRLLGNSGSNLRRGRVAMALTSSDVLSSVDLIANVFPKIKAYVGALDYAA